MSQFTRPALHEIPLAEVRLIPGSVTITMSEGQWDLLLAESYKRGYTLLELDEYERPRRAYKAPGKARGCECDLCRQERQDNPCVA